MGMTVPGLYFTLWVNSEQSCSLSFSRLWFCNFSLSCHCPLLPPSLHCSWSWPFGAVSPAGGWETGNPLSRNAPAEPRVLAGSSAGVACGESQCREGFPAAGQVCHKPLPSPEQASPPSWENSVTFWEVFGWMEEIKSYLPVLVQPGMPCLGLHNMSPLF